MQGITIFRKFMFLLVVLKFSQYILSTLLDDWSKKGVWDFWLLQALTSLRWPLRANPSPWKHVPSPYKRVVIPWKSNFSVEYCRWSVAGSLFSVQIYYSASPWKPQLLRGNRNFYVETRSIYVKNDTVARTGHLFSVETCSFFVETYVQLP
jgi:hypothetical protein